MTPEKYDILLKVIDRWDVDIENGIVNTKFGKVTSECLGYKRITTSYGGKNVSFRVHQVIVVKSGLNPINMTVNHINGNKLDNRISNLEIVTSKENTRHAVKTGLRVAANAISDDDIRSIRKEAIEGKLTQREIAKKYNVGVGSVSEIKTGKRGRNIL